MTCMLVHEIISFRCISKICALSEMKISRCLKVKFTYLMIAFISIKLGTQCVNDERDKPNDCQMHIC